MTITRRLATIAWLTAAYIAYTEVLGVVASRWL